ncbi:MAG: LLM class F420-dependent oxidoreductase [Actinomycetia bacterium]|nr:LLM class F420-dependent oxidoreductase [Actinomycetes bacterium]
MTDFRIFTEPQQGATYDDLLAVALTAEELGFDAFFRSDHYLKMGDGDGLPGPTDAWITLAGLARDTSTIRLGTLVNSATFRMPGPLAISVAGVDQMSGGRVELGLGAGWYEGEHTAYGIPFPTLGERFDNLEEQLAIITGMWAATGDSPFSYNGKVWSVENSPGLPKPVQAGGVPIVIGGGGPRRTPALAARYGAEFNRPFAPVDKFAESCDRVGAACEAIDRDPGSIRYSAALVLACGENEAELERRCAAIGRDGAELRENGAGGLPGQVAEKLNTYVAAGADRIYLQVLDLADLDHLRLVAEQVIPHVD